MTNLFRRLLDVLAGSSQADLRRQIQYLKAENEILRSKITGPVRVTAQERSRLVRLAKPLGAAIKTLASPRLRPRNHAATSASRRESTSPLGGPNSRPID